MDAIRRNEDDAIFHDDGRVIVDERQWDIALWSKAWAGSLMRRSVAIFGNVRKGNVLLIRTSVLVDFLIVDPVSPLVLRS